MAFHREQVEEELVAGGMAPEAAHYAAMRQFGNATKLREQSHEAGGVSSWRRWCRTCVLRCGNGQAIRDLRSRRF